MATDFTVHLKVDVSSLRISSRRGRIALGAVFDAIALLRGANRLGVCFGETPTGDLICGFDLGENRLDFQDVICL